VGDDRFYLYLPLHIRYRIRIEIDGASKVSLRALRPTRNKLVWTAPSLTPRRMYLNSRGLS
jgi:hypothetical protein